MAREWAAKHFVLAAVTLVVGLVIGGLGPRAEVRSLRAQLEEIGDAPRGRGVGRDIASMFRGRPWEGSVPEDPPLAEDGTERKPRPKQADPADPEAEDAEGEPIVDGTFDENAARMKEAMEIRRAQAIAALREQADASDEQMAAVDAIVGDMNADLQALAEDFVATAREGEPSRRDLMVFASDTLEVFIGTEDALYEALPEDQRDEISQEALDPMSYVDGGIVDVLSELDP